MKPKILVVEDRPENLATARALYTTKDEFDFDYTTDYDEARGALEREIYSGIVTDCFMPRNTGSGDVSLGLSLVDKLLPYARGFDNPHRFMEDAMNQSESNQPLGVLIVEYAIEHQIPYLMLTARHDDFGEGIMYHWCRTNKILFSMPREKEKSEPSFNYGNSWGVALNCVSRGISKGYVKWMEDHLKFLESQGR